MGRFLSLIFLDAVRTKDLRLPCKVVAYFNLVVFAFCALVMHIFGIVSYMTASFHPMGLLYELKEIEEAWMICRAVFAFVMLKGVREENPAYVLPIIIDACTQITASIVFLALQPFSINYLVLKKVVQIVLGFLLDATLLIIVGNFYRRLRMGNLEAESEQPGA